MQIENYLNTYQSILNDSDQNIPDFVRKERDEAREAIIQNGLPDRSDERYRYLDLKLIFENTEYKRIISEPAVTDSLSSFFQVDL